MDVWKELQDKCWNRYKETNNPVGSFSHDKLKGALMVGKIINETIPNKLCLDIGCGILPRPSYMKVANSIDFVGIDPFEGNKERDFEFVQGYAEDLPFRDGTFDGVLFSTSLDHVKDPVKSVNEAYRVLRKHGMLFFWGGIKVYDKKYEAWKAAKKPARYDNNHIWAFTRESLLELFSDFKMVRHKRVNPKGNREAIMIFKKK